MIYVAGGLAAFVLIGTVLYLVNRGAERRAQTRSHRRGIGAGGSASAATTDGASTGNGSCDSGGDGGGGGCD